MPSPIEERRPPITPQLAMRVAVLGGIAFVAFAIVFFRLWFLQVLSGEEYVSQAAQNRVRKVKVEAPRGDMGYYVVSDGTEYPYRVRIRTGSFTAMSIIDKLSKGIMVADLIALIGSLDVDAPEIDR
jgi:hypothetical protein